MSVIRAIVLGIVQGLTEFLPISSSGHLILVREVLGWDFGPEAIEKSFDVALHVGTFIGIGAYFFLDIGRLLKGPFWALWRRSLSAHPYSRLAVLILVATIPAGVAGLLGDEYIERHLGDPRLVCALLVGFGLLMGWADLVGRRQGEISAVGWREAVIIGVAQALALSPGTSRSGVTMTAGLFLGPKREAAARFSFLISLPAIAGAAVYKGTKLAAEGVPEGMLAPTVAGMTAAAIAGLFAVFWLLRFLQRHSLGPFVVYRVVVGVLLLIFFAAR